MEINNVIEVIDRDGWQKVFPLHKRIVYIGSDAHNDVVLEASRGAGITPRHLQLIEMENGYRLVNLSNTAIELGEGQALESHGLTEIADGLRLKLGEFSLIFRFSEGTPTPLPSHHPTAAYTASVQNIGITLSLPSKQLAPGGNLEGAIIVKNRGSQAGVQFHLELEGLAAGCYELGPAPLLFPNAEKTIPLRIRHPQGTALTAGAHRFTVRATAPEAYPNDKAEATEVIQVVPYYRHSLYMVGYE